MRANKGERDALFIIVDGLISVRIRYFCHIPLDIRNPSGGQMVTNPGGLSPLTGGGTVYLYGSPLV